MKEIKQEVFDTGVPSPDCEIECEEDKELSDADIDSDADWNSDPFRPVQVFENEGLSIDSHRSTTSRMHTANKSDNEISEQYEHREGRSSSGADCNFGLNEDNPDQLLLAEVKIKPGFDCFGMSEFKKKIVGRIQRKLANDLRLGNSVLDSDDPRKKYLVQFDVKTETLTVNDIEIIVHDNEESVKCSLCDFSITDKNIKRFGKNRAAEALVQDHIIGVHIGGYKCDVCNKMLPQYRYLKEHQRAHSQQWTCETCGKSYCNKFMLTNHQQQQHLCKSKSKQEAALKSRIQVPLKQLRRRKNIRASLLKRRIKRDSKPTYDTHGVSRCEQGIVSGTRKRRTLRLNSRDSSDDSNANKQKLKRTEETQKLAAPYGSIHMARSDVDTLEISEFKQSIVRRVMKRLSKEKGVYNEGDFSDKPDNNIERDTTDAEEFSFPDPRKKYPVEFDAKTGTLSVNNIEIIVQEGERCIKCSMCDFSISDDQTKKYGKMGRSVEAVIQDHIIGVHMGGYKCEGCNKHLPQYRYLKEHQRAHGRRWNCDICGKPFQTKGGMKDHKWYHMNTAEKEVAIRHGMKNPFERIAELSTSKCDPNELSEFKQGIVTSVLRNLERRTRGLNLKRDINGDNSNDTNSNYGEAAENNEDDTFQSIRYDPRMKYPVEYDVGMQKLSVKDIEIIVHDIEECLKCSLCDFTVADEDRRRFGGVRTFEAIMQDHIIGIHIGSCKNPTNSI
ncbi:unnamed protein product [Orchesella dallaii]|uniref:C2H2-type domain-containing protein n=1 Tax=Orchesella dallaii TaxID=48710 RepID=A0ABP1QFN9_9HEXA